MSAFKTRGFEATTMEQIAADADIAKGTLYNYFPVKEAIIDEYMKRLFQQRSPEKVEAALQGADTRARMRLAFTDLLRGRDDDAGFLHEIHHLPLPDPGLFSPGGQPAQRHADR